MQLSLSLAYTVAAISCITPVAFAAVPLFGQCKQITSPPLTRADLNLRRLTRWRAWVYRSQGLRCWNVLQLDQYL